MGWRCRFLLFSSNNSLLAKVKRSPFLFSKESFEEVVACSKECMKQRCVVQRQDPGWPLWERNDTSLTSFVSYSSPESTGSCLLDTSTMQMPFRCCLGASLGRAKPVLQRPSLRLLAALETLGSRRASAPMSQVAKLGREETASFAWFYPCTMKCAILKSQSKLWKMTRNFGALNFPQGKGKSVIFLMPEENKFRENVATQPEAGVQGVVLLVGLQCSFYKNSQSWNCPIGEKCDCLRNKIKWSPSSFCEGPCKASIQRDGFAGRLNERMPKGQWVIEAGPPPLQVPASVWAWNVFQAWNFYTGACSWTRYAPLWVWTLNLFLSLSFFFFPFLVLFLK